MNTQGRLDGAFERAKRISFNDDSKFIFFSDVHRGDNSLADEFAHNQNIYYYALNKYFEDGYTYIEIGDGDELWEHSNFNHIRNAHSDVYLLIKKFFDEDRFIMLYGNHNMQFKHNYYVKKDLYKFFDPYDEEVKELYPGIEVHESIVLEHEETDGEIFVTHGHQGDFINDQIWPVMLVMNRYFWRFFHIVGFQNPASPAKNRHKMHKIEKNFSKWIEENEKIMIIGHTHRPKFPRENEPSYFNAGCCVHPRNITGIEIVNGKISLVDWRIRPNKEGKLRISKRHIKGPSNIKEFMYISDQYDKTDKKILY
jgi:predicted phosphodiesterase